MNIIGILEKTDSRLFEHKDILEGEGLEKVNFQMNDKLLTVFFDDSNIKVVNNDKMFFASQDNLFVKNDDRVSSLSDDVLIEILSNKKEKILSDIISNINIVFFDKLEGKLVLSSNRAAAGRIFYVKENDTIIFSNNFALLARINGNIELNDQGVFSFLKYGAVTEDISFFEHIRSIPVGHFAKIALNDLSIRNEVFFQLEHNNEDNSIDEKLLDEVEANLDDILKEFSSDKIHLLISGGIDSSLIGFMLKKYNRNFVGHFCKFGESDPEEVYAKKVAKELGVQLQIHIIKDDMIVQQIKNTAKNTTYPHADFSSIAVNFLIEEIHKDYGKNSIIIECNGADDGFGYGGLNQITFWKKLYKIPTFILNLISSFIKYSDLWMYDSSLIRKLMSFYRAKEKNIYSSHTISSGGEMVFKNEKKLNVNVVNSLTRYLNEMIVGDDPTFYEQMNIAQFFHINSRLWVAKGYTPSEKIGIKMVFPFTWKNILEIQAKIPLSMKINNGIVKWPLKKMLEKYIDKDFIYRKKSGFAPPLIEWLDNEETLSFFYNTIFEGKLIQDLEKKKIRKIFKLLKSKKKVSRFAKNLIWSIFFFEEWIKQNDIIVK